MPAAWKVDDLDTPCVLIDLDKVEANLARAQAYADRHRIRLRPHIKTHKVPELARRQVALGAVGITCQKLGEAEVMADHGLDDILLTYNLLGPAKLARLAALARRARVAVTLDSEPVARGLAEAASAAGLAPLPVLVECDTGGERCGAQDPAEALALARLADSLPGLRFEGLMTYPARGGTAATSAWIAEALALLGRHGLEARTVSTGGSPDLYRAHEVAGATEHRPGTYVYSDRYQAAHGLGTLDDCALRVLTTVVSRPTATRLILDAGSKSLSSDTLGMDGFGHVVEYPHLAITKLSEEHGHVEGGGARPALGERVTVIPDHACVVSNLHDVVHGVRGDRVERAFAVAARGRVG